MTAKATFDADRTTMPADAFDALMAAIDVADPSPLLDHLAALPRLIASVKY